MDKQDKLNELFDAARLQQPLQSFETTTDHFLNSIPGNASGLKVEKMKFSFTKKVSMLLITVSIFVASIFIGMNGESGRKIVQKRTAYKGIEKKSLIFTEDIDNSDVEKVKLNIEKDQIRKEESFVLVEQLDIHSLNIDSSTLYTNMEPIAKNAFTTEEYIFPKLTDEEIIANHKQKKQMLKALEKFDKKDYAFLVSGSFDFNGKIISINSFVIQKTEVSNLEYRTFLFDLLIQDRKEEFLKAKPDQAMWTKLFGKENKPMEDLYFSHPAYNDYPVVNISREGAELYCKWISQELYKFIDVKKRDQYNDVRLPAREEWVRASMIEGKNGPYPWDGQFVRNSKGCFLANFKPTDSTYFDDGAFHTAKVDSYFPNDFGLYNMSGNVAEMVYDDYKIKTSGTAGGGWMSSAEEIKILGPDPHKGNVDPHPNIGFRVVMTYRNQ